MHGASKQESQLTQLPTLSTLASLLLIWCRGSQLHTDNTTQTQPSICMSVSGHILHHNSGSGNTADVEVEETGSVIPAVRHRVTLITQETLVSSVSNAKLEKPRSNGLCRPRARNRSHLERLFRVSLISNQLQTACPR